MVGNVHDVITCAKFQIEIFMGYDFTWGRIFDFPIDFSMGLTTVQRYCAAGATALPVIDMCVVRTFCTLDCNYDQFDALKLSIIIQCVRSVRRSTIPQVALKKREKLTATAYLKNVEI